MDEELNMEPVPWHASKENALKKWCVYDYYFKRVSSESAIKLFAASPELLAVTKRVLNFNDLPGDFRDQAQEAIAKAQGN